MRSEAKKVLAQDDRDEIINNLQSMSRQEAMAQITPSAKMPTAKQIAKRKKKNKKKQEEMSLVKKHEKAAKKKDKKSALKNEAVKIYKKKKQQRKLMRIHQKQLLHCHHQQMRHQQQISQPMRCHQGSSGSSVNLLGLCCLEGKDQQLVHQQRSYSCYWRKMRGIRVRGCNGARRNG